MRESASLLQVVVCVAGCAACGYPSLPDLGPEARDAGSDAQGDARIDAPPGPDVTGPRVVTTTPANAAAAVDVQAPITAVFDEALDATSVTTATAVVTAPGGTSIPATVAAVDRTITITPAQRLPGGALMTAKITAQVRDTAGNALLAEFSWAFTTGYGTDVVLGVQEFTGRDFTNPHDGIADGFVGGTPPPRLLFIKKGTEDRAIVELDISRFPVDVASARLDFVSKTLDPGGSSTRLQIYRFDGNGVPDLSDYSRTATLFAEEFGANDATEKAHSFDITAELENARVRGVQHLGLLFLAADIVDRFDLVDSSQDPARAPRLTVSY